MLFRTAEKLLTDIETQKSFGKNIELRMSVYQIYQDIITDLMVFGSRGLIVTEKEERNVIENLTEHTISTVPDLRAHVHHAYQIRKNIIKPDPKLKLKSHFIIMFSLYENHKFLSQIALIELAGSENASNDPQTMKSNSLSIEEKKCIARNLNALSAVINNEPWWKESSLTMACKTALSGNKVFLCTVNTNPGIFKHTLASLKYSARVREESGKSVEKAQKRVKDELYRLRNEVKNTRDISADWVNQRETEVRNIEQQIKANGNLLGSPQECEEFLIECEILRKQLKMLNRKSATPPLPHPIRRRSASPSEEVSTDRDHYIRQKLSQLQGQNDSQLKKIEDITGQIEQRDIDIKKYYFRIGELERVVYDKDRVIEEQNCKITDLTGKLNEYSKRFKMLQDQSSKTLTQAQATGSREEILEFQIIDLDKRLLKDRDDFLLQIHKLKLNLQSKDKLIQELQSSGSYCVNEKDSAIQDLKQKLKTKNNTIGDLEKQLLSLSNNYNESRFKLEVESSSSKKYEEECLMLRRKIEDLGVKLASADSKCLLLMQKNETLEKELNSARQEVECRKFKSQQLGSSLKEMENTIYASSEEAVRLKCEMNQLRSENQMLRVDKENLYLENCDIREENNLIKEDLKSMADRLGETQQFSEREKSLQMTGELGKKKRKNKISSLKETVAVLQQQLKDCQNIAEEEIKKALDERDQALLEVEEYKGSQIQDLSMVETQVEIIEDQLLKLKEQNKVLISKESELHRELRNVENGKEKYKEMVVEMKEEIKVLQAQLAEMDEYTSEYIENHRKEISEMKLGEEKTLVLKSRIRALHDVKNMILAHRVQR